MKSLYSATELIPTEISSKVEFCKGSLYFTKLTTPACVSHSTRCSYSVTGVHPLRRGSVFSLTLGRGYDHLDLWGLVEAKLWDFTLGRNKGTASVGLSRCLPLDLSHHIVRKPQPHGENASGGSRQQSQLGPQLRGSIGCHIRTSPRVIPAPTLQTFQPRLQSLWGREKLCSRCDPHYWPAETGEIIVALSSYNWGDWLWGLR